jgi:CheY-like chemotaxis protein
MPRTILLADDSVTIRKIVELTFGDADIRVESVASGHEAITRFHDLHPDLVLADVVMPGPSGYDVCRAVKASEHPVPVMLLTGTFEPFDAEEARACGSDGHLTKPFDSKHLVERVEQLLEREASQSAATGAEDDLEAMFDDLAATERPGMIDAPALGASVEPFAPTDRAAPEDSPSPSPTPALSPADIDAIARLVVARLSERVIRRSRGTSCPISRKSSCASASASWSATSANRADVNPTDPSRAGGSPHRGSRCRWRRSIAPRRSKSTGP